jgi:hypothetical protein
MPATSIFAVASVVWGAPETGVDGITGGCGLGGAIVDITVTIANGVDGNISAALNA